MAHGIRYTLVVLVVGVSERLFQQGESQLPGYYNVFSKRDKSHPEVFQYDQLPDSLRRQLVHIIVDDIFGVSFQHCSVVHHILCREHGLFTLDGSEDWHQRSHIDQIKKCILTEKDVSLVLDIVELAMRLLPQLVDQCLISDSSADNAVEQINFRFRENGLGYVFNREANDLIRVDSTLLYESAVAPALSLLHDARYTAASSEFIAAWDDYKAGDFKDCVVKACSGFESVLKVICADKGWPFDPSRDTCGTLVTTVVQNGGLESFLSQPLTLIGSIRNRMSSAHGGGATIRDIPESLARYCLNATAASILYVVEATT